MNNHALIEHCKKLRYDLTAAQSKLSDILQTLEGANIALAEPLPAVTRIERQIANGVLTDLVELEAELKANPALTDAERVALRGLIAA